MKGGKENPKHGGGSSRSQHQAKPRNSRWDKEKQKEKAQEQDKDRNPTSKSPSSAPEDPKKVAETAATSSIPPDSKKRSIAEAGASQNPTADPRFANNPLPEPAAQWRRPPVPQIGFEIFEKRSITMPDGGVRTYYALPENPSEPPAFVGNPNPSPNPVFDFGPRDSNPIGYGRESNQFNQFNPPEDHRVREAELERFYGGQQMHPYGAAMGVEGSVPRDPREQYFSPERGRERDLLAREDFSFRNSGPAEPEAQGYMRQMREMEAEEFYRREREKRAEYSRMDEESLRQSRPGMSRSALFESPHGASASGLGIHPLERDVMHERWESPSGMGLGGLRRKAEDDHDYQRPKKFQKQSDGFDERRPRISSERRPHDNDVQRAEDSEEFRNQVQKTFLRFSKVINENSEKCKKYQENGKAGHVHCIVCGWQSKNFMDTHSLIMHAYDAENPALRTEHLGLYKALCVVMGWSYSLPPDVDKSYQSLTLSEAVANKEDLILWPPMVIIHNAYSGKKKDGIGNREMDEQLKELGFTGGKAKALYGKDGHHKGTVVIKFAPSSFGLQEADRLFKYFEVNKHGRKDWLRVQASTTNQENDDNNPDLIEVDKKTKLDKRVLYGYIGTARDLDQLDFDLKKKALVKSRREMNALANDVTRVA